MSLAELQESLAIFARYCGPYPLGASHDELHVSVPYAIVVVPADEARLRELGWGNSEDQFSEETGDCSEQSQEGYWIGFV